MIERWNTLKAKALADKRAVADDAERRAMAPRSVIAPPTPQPPHSRPSGVRALAPVVCATCRHGRFVDEDQVQCVGIPRPIDLPPELRPALGPESGCRHHAPVSRMMHVADPLGGRSV